ncbi:hypothetical protein LZD49_04740 [Dyadobacter sp. CY261]|uniref:hypothetical protein n=1 Tax=Dyadobacter sp. CY261 TaxID=2907203 RepID=UPI001F448607|nr:hypothetical protein [Dyadobacter sp. CY261]MCF0069767.1 hypothetical protein [Dyadobacter sp. CY261]
MSTSKPFHGGGINISQISGSVFILGDDNTVTATINFKQFEDSREKSDHQLWKDITSRMEELLKTVKGLGDEHEELRDIELTPVVGSAKKEAAEIAANPQKSKVSFIEKLNKICDLSSKAVDVGAKVAPFVTIVAKLLGIAI